MKYFCAFVCFIINAGFANANAKALSVGDVFFAKWKHLFNGIGKRQRLRDSKKSCLNLVLSPFLVIPATFITAKCELYNLINSPGIA